MARKRKRIKIYAFPTDILLSCQVIQNIGGFPKNAILAALFYWWNAGCYDASKVNWCTLAGCRDIDWKRHQDVINEAIADIVPLLHERYVKLYNAKSRYKEGGKKGIIITNQINASKRAAKLAGKKLHDDSLPALKITPIPPPPSYNNPQFSDRSLINKVKKDNKMNPNTMLTDE